MSQQQIVTIPVNSGEGDPAYTAFNKCNSNFTELYNLSLTYATMAQVEATITLSYLGGTTAAAALSAAQAAITLTSLGANQAYIGGQLWPRTPAEIAAGVMPVNYQYAPGNVMRYGAVGDGVTDDTTAIADMLACGAQQMVLENGIFLCS
ncbi:MAG: hypothetical protein WBW93_14400, partial [Steroidobacteraceae bacterium]